MRYARGCIAVLGDQSSGKTTLCIALTRQPAFLVDPKTGTKTRTLITYAHDPRAMAWSCSLESEGCLPPPPPHNGPKQTSF